MDYDILIAGAGLYGAVFAHEAAAKGKRVLVIDRRDHIAGNCYTEEVRAIHVHRYGAHIFHTSDREVWDYVQRFAEFNHYVNAPVAVYKDELYNLPFNMNTFSKLWGIKTPAEAKEILERQRAEAERLIREKRGGDASPGEAIEARNLEEQGLLLAGRDIFDKLIRGYTEKQWGRPCSELPAFIINRIPFRFIYDNNYFDDPYQGIPKEGYTALCARLLGTDAAFAKKEALPGKIDVRLQTAFEDFVVTADGVPERFAKEDGTFVYHTTAGDTASRIVYTGRIDLFFRGCLGALEYRSLRFETEDMPDIDNYQGNAVVNYTEREVPYTRIIEHKHFNFGTGEGTIITREYPDAYEEGKEPYYPVNDEKNDALYARYEALAKERCEGILFGGRLGRYRYYNMDRVIRTALDDVCEALADS